MPLQLNKKTSLFLPMKSVQAYYQQLTMNNYHFYYIYVSHPPFHNRFDYYYMLMLDEVHMMLWMLNNMQLLIVTGLMIQLVHQRGIGLFFGD